MSGRKWSEKEIGYLKRNFGRMTAKKIAQMINRTEMSIYQRAHKLQIKLSSKEVVKKEKPIKERLIEEHKPNLRQSIKMNQDEKEIATKFLNVLAIAKTHSDRTGIKANVNLNNLREAFQGYNTLHL